MKTLCLAIALLIPLLATAAPATLQVDKANSRVEIDVKATVDSFTGRLADHTSDIRLDDAGNVQAATFTFHLADVKTGKADRDRQMHVWLETELHPEGVFTLEKIVTEETGGLSAQGLLRLHGVSRPLSFPIAITRDGVRIAIDGTATLDTRDHGLPIIRKFMLLKVDPLVVVRFHLQGSAAPTGQSK